MNRVPERENSKDLEHIMKDLYNAKHVFGHVETRIHPCKAYTRNYTPSHFVFDSLVYELYPSKQNETIFLNGMETCLNNGLIKDAQTNYLIDNLKSYYLFNNFDLGYSRNDFNDKIGFYSDCIRQLVGHLLKTYINTNTERKNILDDAQKTATDIVVKDSKTTNNYKNDCLKKMEVAYLGYSNMLSCFN